MAGDAVPFSISDTSNIRPIDGTLILLETDIYKPDPSNSCRSHHGLGGFFPILFGDCSASSFPSRKSFICFSCASKLCFS